MTALIAVEHHPAGLTTGFPCHFQRFHGEPAVRRERHGPAHWFSCEQVENNGEVRPALTRPDIGHITAPHLIWLGHGELPFKKGDTSLYSRNLNISDHTKNGAGIESYNFMTTAGLKYYF